MRFCKARFQAQGLSKAFHGFTAFPLARENISQAEVKNGGAAIESDGPPDQLFGLGGFPFLLIHQPENVQGIGMVGGILENPTVKSLRFFPLAIAVVGNGPF